MRESTLKKRQRMIETALEMFAKYGYENVSVDDIIAATKTSKGTFYHYFSGKDEIVMDVNRHQKEILDRWKNRPAATVKSLEGHINRLFLDLASNLEPSPLLVRGLLDLTLRNETIRTRFSEQMQELREALLRWLPEPGKVDVLVDCYIGTLMSWSLTAEDKLTDMMEKRLSLVWDGLRHQNSGQTLVIEPKAEGEAGLNIVVIGGGLAGLTAAAYLSELEGVRGLLLERSPQLGGRAFTYEKSGFTLNYGAHAIYGIDRHTISTLEKELSLSFSSNQVDKSKVMYEKNEKVSQAPLDFLNLVRTDLLNVKQKVRFVGEIAAIIANIHHLKDYETLGEYLAWSKADDDVKELWEHLVCSNFFIAPEDARLVPGPVISEYYQNLFLSQRPVNYIIGSWAVITNQLKQKIESSGRWDISVREGAEQIRYENGKYKIVTKNREIDADRVIFAMPVQQSAKLLKGTPWEPFLAPYEQNTSTDVVVHDVGLKRIVARPFSYISDMNHKLFISDVSATDPTLVPEGGQLLQGIAYIHEEAFSEEQERRAYLEQRLKEMEALFDRHYPGWREEIEVKRISKKAMVQSVKPIIRNRMLPVRIENVPFYFCGDGCEGKGQLAERAFSSAREAARLLKEEVLSMRMVSTV